jgi:hypothetical protein
MESPPAQPIRIGLFREFNGSWVVDVSIASGAALPDVDRLRTELIKAIGAAGYQARARSKPTFGPTP